MRGSEKHDTIWRLSSRAMVAAGGCIPVIGATLQIPSNKLPGGAMGSATAFIHSNAAILLLLAALVALCAEWVRVRFGNPWAWRTVDSLLDQLREHLIADQYLDEPLHRHRVTLFRHQRFKIRPAFSRCWAKGVKWRFPWKGWLVKVARSGHTNQNSIRIFYAPDDAKYAEGVAGQTWARCNVFDVKKLALPQLNNEQSIRDYARETSITAEYVRDMLVKGYDFPRSMMGIPIEKSGKAWGVIVVDSIAADGIESYGNFDRAIVIAQTAISQLTNEL